MLDTLAAALPPDGAIAQGEAVGERDAALLQRFWVSFFGSEEEGGPAFVLRGEDWKRAGFQRDDPISDLRACGLLALQQLVRSPPPSVHACVQSLMIPSRYACWASF